MTGWVLEAYCVNCPWKVRGDQAVYRQADAHGKQPGHATVTRSRVEGMRRTGDGT